MRCTRVCRPTSLSSNCTKLRPSTPLSTSVASIRPLRLPAGRSICVTSPLTTILELKPWRVSTIFICSAVQFCASSRMMKLSLSVRPRIKAMGDGGGGQVREGQIAQSLAEGLAKFGELLGCRQAGECRQQIGGERDAEHALGQFHQPHRVLEGGHNCWVEPE